MTIIKVANNTRKRFNKGKNKFSILNNNLKELKTLFKILKICKNKFSNASNTL